MDVLNNGSGDYQLSLNDLVEVKAIATNSIGTAASTSPVNTSGATVDTVPTAMGDPAKDSANSS